MKAFSALLDALVFAPQRSAKLRLMQRYFRETPDPDRGYALAALTGSLSFPHAKPALIRALVAERVDPALFALSYDYVGDLAETAALIWPARGGPAEPPRLAAMVETLGSAEKGTLPGLVAETLDQLDESGRLALLKLITGGLRVGVSARLAKTALAELGDVEVAAIEEVWHGLDPPYTRLFAWLEGRGARPAEPGGLGFRPMMLATPLEERDLPTLDPADHAAEWKWDGIRVQLASRGGEARLWSRTGDDITLAFPDVIAGAAFDAVIDGELLVVRGGVVAPFSHLQQRLNRKTVGTKLLEGYPAAIMVYDLLAWDGEDIRALPFAERRRRLELWMERMALPRLALSPLVRFTSWSDLAGIRAAARGDGIEGLMVKRWDSTYRAGRLKGPWFKWKREPLTVDCVLMYAQRGHGKRSSFYSDYTFGCWLEDAGGTRTLVPVGKAYFGFTDAELAELDRWVRAHTVDRFGPVRAVRPELVLEIAFDSVHLSSRHKSGLAMRFPRVSRIRRDKPAAEADSVDALRALIAPI
ncbi:MAG: cisplatin damage response ATP-dependent DNA ligase [Rhodospirillales bacterium]|nr:MAG: cisplatin damage response ATP-dependent DNA ligase [Rhodospirillales bacterium]